MNRVTVTMNDEILFTIRKIQSEMTKELKGNVSFSRVIKAVLLVGFQEKKMVRQVIRDDRQGY